MSKLTHRKVTKSSGGKEIRLFTTKELALISVLSSLWIVSEIYLGPIISQITHIHGVIQRVLGWFLMLVLAEIMGRFGGVAAMATISSSATRIIRPGRVYSLFVGFGYALGGLTFDLLCFLPLARKLEGRTRKAYFFTASVLSGIVALIPYLLFRLSLLGFFGFLLWIPLYTYNMTKSVALSILGTLIGISVLPRIEIWASKVRYTEGLEDRD